jgi:hypothetical protein
MDIVRKRFYVYGRAETGVSKKSFKIPNQNIAIIKYMYLTVEDACSFISGLS